MQEELLSIWQRRRKTVVFVTHDVQEACYLAERIAVMSARPGRIKEIVDSRIQRKGAGAAEVARLRRKVDYVWNLVRQEAIAAERGAPNHEAKLVTKALDVPVALFARCSS